MIQRLKLLAKDTKLQQVDSFALAILSHGEDNEMVIGTDCRRKVKVTDIFKIFGLRNCPFLRGKPKLFIINACRGGKSIITRESFARRGSS